MQPLKKYTHAVIATDAVIFTIEDNQLKILLMKMTKHPYEKQWALPGGLVKPTESLKDSIIRQIKERTRLKNVFHEQLYTFGNVERDPFGRVVSVAYLVLIPPDHTNLHRTRTNRGLAWAPTAKLPRLAYDHKQIAALAIKRLKDKISYTNIIKGLMQEEFTFPELQKVYEIIKEQTLDKRNFRKLINSRKMLTKTDRRIAGKAYRPALLYQFASKELTTYV